jgi:hypothetical protein
LENGDIGASESGDVFGDVLKDILVYFFKPFLFYLVASEKLFILTVSEFCCSTWNCFLSRTGRTRTSVLGKRI